ncbi:hypothetical protein [Virgibacillus salexigens]|uniref:hypothetical protein n=1 Tax=Virgibacillus massiliensis TaxID=1462526 RepID=UPI0013701E77|nr:hypothetical protein [Virgibacillus massiliensis]MYL43984.1 hypothetical protein [Virgibacillus massiliensis]
MDNSRDSNLLGSVIYEHDNPKQQALLVKDLRSDFQSEFNINSKMEFSHDGRNHSLKDLLSEKSLNNLSAAINNKSNTSFTLTNKEMENLQKKNIVNVNQSTNVDAVSLKNQYKEYLTSLKAESKGELTEEKIVNRMNAENTYNSMKNQALKSNVVTKETLSKMENNVKQSLKHSNQNSMTM